VQATLGGSTATHLIDQVSIPLGGTSRSRSSPAPSTRSPPTKTPPAASGNPQPGRPRRRRRHRTGTTAAENFNWGDPLAASDDFTTGTIDTTKWSIYNGPGHDGNGRRLPARVAIVNGILTITGLANGDTAGLAHKLDQQYGRWEIRVRSRRTDTTGGGGGGGGGGGTPAQTLGVGGVATPAGAILATADQAAALNITSGGTSGAPKVYDGQGHTVGRITVTADWVVVQNFRDRGEQPVRRSSTAPTTSSSRTATSRA
jgi:hypothetical protein